LKELSIFIDESGDFGEYALHSPYYIITMVFHNQKNDISLAVKKLNQELSHLNLDNLCIHTGPIIRREEIYSDMSLEERRRIFNKMVAFIRQIDIKYKYFYIDKKPLFDLMPLKQQGNYLHKYHDLFMNTIMNFYHLTP